MEEEGKEEADAASGRGSRKKQTADDCDGEDNRWWWSRELPGMQKEVKEGNFGGNKENQNLFQLYGIKKPLDFINKIILKFRMSLILYCVTTYNNMLFNLWSSKFNCANLAPRSREYICLRDVLSLSIN